PPKREFDIIIVDPPRAGLTTNIIKRLIALGCPKIIYVSCNPLSLKRDLEELNGYRLKGFQAFDMFPQTKYVETLTILEKA
ncbi:MAG: 23S rRNA (uracil-5-)-methyltransferase RumA, partial [Acidobacteriota bacterium]